MRRPRDLLVAFVVLVLGVGVLLGAVALARDDGSDATTAPPMLLEPATTAPRATTPERPGTGTKQVGLLTVRLPAARVRVNAELRDAATAVLEARFDKSPAVAAWARNVALDAPNCVGVAWFVQLTDSSPATLDELQQTIPVFLLPRTDMSRLQIVPGARATAPSGTPTTRPCKPAAPRVPSPTTTTIPTTAIPTATSPTTTSSSTSPSP